MADSPRYFLTTAIDYPNRRPHIGTALEKLGADVQARYRRMEGYDVYFLMGNDENTVKVSKRAAELGLDPKTYCDDMARQFKEVWCALEISFDDFIQTSEARHHTACRQFIQKVYDNGYIYKGSYEGWYCEGCEAFKTDTEIQEAGGVCPDHKVPPVRRSEPCYFLRSVEVPGETASSSTTRIRTLFSRKLGGTRSLNFVQSGLERHQHHALAARHGGYACRSMRTSPSGFGSTPC